MPWRGPEEPGEFPTLGYVALDWIEANLPIPDGPKQGQPFTVYDEQAMHLLNKFRLDPEAVEDDGNDAFRYGGSMLVRGQKWGKDPLLAAILLFQCFGPCDFAGWNADGDPVGRPNVTPWGAIAALNDKQTDNTWLPLKWMVENSALVDLPGVEVTKEQITLPCGNPIEPLPTTAFGRLGGRFTALTLTENGLMTDTLSSQAASSGRRSPLSFARTLIRSVTGLGGMWTAATNTWDPTDHSHAQRIHASKSTSIYVDAKLSRKKVDLDDDEELREELLYLYGDSAKENGGHVPIKRLMGDCRDTEVHGETEIRRFFLSEILAGEKQLATPELWAAADRGNAKHEDHSPLRAGETITLGFDGSRARDATVLTACRTDGRLFHLRTWLPERQHDGAWRISRTDVDQAVRAAFKAYDVKFLFADPFKWETYLDTWAGAFPKRVVEFATNEERRMDKAINRFLTGLRTGELTYDDSLVPTGEMTLTTFVENTVIKKGKVKPSERQDDDGTSLEHYLALAKKAEGALIDGSVSAVLAYEALGNALEHGALQPAGPAPFVLFDDDE